MLKNCLIILGIVALTACGGNKSDRIHSKIEKLQSKIDSTPSMQIKSSDYLALAEAYHEYLNEVKDSNTTRYHDKAIKNYILANDYDKALSLVDSFIINNPDNKETPKFLLFYKGVSIYEQGLKDKAKAEEVYKEFLEKYPEDALVPDALFLLELLNATEEDLLKKIEEFEAANKENQDEEA